MFNKKKNTNNKIFNTMDKSRYCVEIIRYTKDYKFYFDAEKEALVGVNSQGTIEISFKGCDDLKEVKNAFARYIHNDKIDLLSSEQLFTWYYNIPEELRNDSIYKCPYVSDKQFFFLLKQIEDCFNDAKFYLSHDKDTFNFILNVKLPYFDKNLQMNLGWGKYDFKMVKENILSELIEQSLFYNASHSKDYNSTEKIRDAFEKMLEVTAEPRLKYMISDGIKSLPSTKQDYINIYLYHIDMKNAQNFKENKFNLIQMLKDIKKGNVKKDSKVEEFINLKRVFESYDKNMGINEIKQYINIFKPVFDFLDGPEYDRVLKSLNYMSYNALTEQQIKDYEYALHIASFLGFEEKKFIMSETDIHFNNASSTIGEYFYIEGNGSIMPNLEKFENLPKEFFDVIGRIENSEMEQIYEFERE